MDYQRACGCRMGRSSSPTVYRTVQMGSASLKNRDENTSSARTYSEQRGGRSDCCGDKNQNYPSLAIVTSPSQVWQKLYTPCDAMTHGTLFCELYKPWVGCKTGGRMR